MRIGIKRLKIGAWIAPAFLLLLVAAFAFFPASMMDKLHGVCFGI
jgi:hypothetical protein